MHFASDVGALLLVSRKELLGVFAVEGEEAPLVDEDRGTQRRQDDRNGKDGPQVDPDDIGTGHRIPFQIRI